MAVSVKHKFTSAKADGPDSTQIRPSNWNDAHDIDLAGPALLGKSDAGTGAATEIAVGAGLAFDGASVRIPSGGVAAGMVAADSLTAAEMDASAAAAIRSKLDLFATIGGLISGLVSIVLSTGTLLHLRHSTNDTDTRTAMQFLRGSGAAKIFDVATVGNGSNGLTRLLVRAFSAPAGSLLGTVTFKDDGRLAVSADASDAEDLVRKGQLDAVAASANASGQEWTDVTGSRSSGTPYTNDTGRVIDVSIRVNAAGNPVLQVNSGSGWRSVAFATVGAVSNTQTLYARIPPGHSYRINPGTVFNWMELR